MEAFLRSCFDTITRFMYLGNYFGKAGTTSSPYGNPKTIPDDYHEEVIFLESRRRADLQTWQAWSTAVLRRYEMEREEEIQSERQWLNTRTMTHLQEQYPELDQVARDGSYFAQEELTKKYHDARRKDLEALREDLAELEEFERKVYVRKRRAIEEKYHPRRSLLQPWSPSGEVEGGRGSNSDNATTAADSNLWTPE